jgi:hypothetical protein
MLLKAQARHVQHMQRTLMQMNIATGERHLTT